MVRDKQLVYDRAEEMAERYLNQIKEEGKEKEKEDKASSRMPKASKSSKQLI